MKSKKTIWGSIGLLIGVVIAILALVRGAWQLPLLIGTFAVWGLWVLWTQVLPFQRAMQVQRQKEQAEHFNRAMAQTLLRHVNYRVSDCLKAGYPIDAESAKSCYDFSEESTWPVFGCNEPRS